MRRRIEPEEESGYSWMDTYGDMVTLLLCFFVLLYSFSSLNAEKWQELIGAFSGSSGSAEIRAFDELTAREQPITEIDTMVNYDSREESDEDSESTVNTAQQEINDSFDQLYYSIQTYIDMRFLEDQLSVSRTDDVIILRLDEMALFNSGDATILPESEETLNNVIEIIYNYLSSISMVNIEGHTDNMPISTEEFSDNWDLSAKRATNTLRLILETGLIDEGKLSAVGYGEYQPVSTNETEEGRAQNRRVDFVLNKMNVT